MQVTAADAQAALAAATAAVQQPEGAEDVEDVDTSDVMQLTQREAQEEAVAERERLRNMTEEERLAWLKANRPQFGTTKDW